MNSDIREPRTMSTFINYENSKVGKSLIDEAYTGS